MSPQRQVQPRSSSTFGGELVPPQQPSTLKGVHFWFVTFQISGYNASCLSKSEVASNDISGEKADVGELFRGREA